MPALAFALLALAVARAPDYGGSPELCPDTPATPAEPRLRPLVNDLMPDDGGSLDFFPDGGVTPPDPQWLHFDGNKVLSDEVYRNVLTLPPDAEPSDELAQHIEEALTSFLQQTGYELATVKANLTPTGINVAIDEGRLEKIVFRGRLTALTLRFRLGLHIEQDIFNRPALERQIAKLTSGTGLKVVKWSLVPTKNPEHMGPQLDNVPAIEGFQILHSRDRYELHFFFEESEWGNGFGLDLRSGYIDGLELGVNEQLSDILLKGERLRVAASIGAGIHTRQDGEYFPTWTRAAAELVWYAPKLGQRLRPFVWLTGQLVNRERADLGLQSYNEASTIGSAHLSVDFTRTFKLAFGVGEQWRRVFNLILFPNTDPAMVAPLVSERLRTFVETRGSWLINSEVERSDRSHALDFGIRYYFGEAVGMTTAQNIGYQQYGWVYEHYKVVIPFGWHDLWIKSNARITAGDVQFHDEQSLGELLRGVFGNNFVRKGGNASAEFRFSLSRDVLKLSLFAEVAAWGQVNRAALPGQQDTESFRYGITGGPGFHALIQGMFQLDIYSSFGWTTIRPAPGLGFGVVVFLNKVF